MTMPGVLTSERPKVVRPSTKTANVTPTIPPTPPVMATPPSTTMVMTSSSKPRAMFGRVEPMRPVSSSAASPAINPISTNSQKRMRLTGTPENSAAVGLLPMA